MSVIPIRKEIRSWIKSSPKFTVLREQYVSLVDRLTREAEPDLFERLEWAGLREITYRPLDWCLALSWEKCPFYSRRGQEGIGAFLAEKFIILAMVSEILDSRVKRKRGV